MEAISTDTTCHYKIEKSGQHYNLSLNGHHFLTVINQVGTFNLRSHPGKDPNGWGTSVYLQPFFPGANLHSSIIKEIKVLDSGIVIVAEGVVCKEIEQTLGHWKVELLLGYDPVLQHISGKGSYTIQLPESVCNLASGDLNLMKIASNYLWNVPLINGEIGNSGDMTAVDFVLDGKRSTWIPDEKTAILSNHDHKGTSIEMCVHGGVFMCDSQKQGFDPIASDRIYKPTTCIGLSRSNAPLGIFAMMSTGKDELASEQYGRTINLQEEYWQDNIGINPLIYADSQESNFTFELTFASSSIEPR